MISKILMLLLSYFTGKFSQVSRPSELAALSADTLKKILSSVVMSVVFVVIFANSVLLLMADLLIQQYSRGQIIMTPTLLGAVIVILVCLGGVFFVLKPRSKDKIRQDSHHHESHGISQITDALAALIHQYTEERKTEMNQRAQRNNEVPKQHLSRVAEQEYSA